MSIIPDFEKAYHKLISQVKMGGEIIIGDMKLATGWQKYLNPISLLLAKRYGGSENGHQHSVQLISWMKVDLVDVKYNDFFIGSYFYCIGRKK